ncbi:hypothetical protein CURE108131_11900 [Cupriavidus respiraculi]|uniref:Uncharacterized protein n=1 Tax=Cupriavidus respiraculi TaxID=195930 RepID=A0ABN7YHK0_9BURK|nr:hypothetical protein [Cupriavidus respiraculi]CAG9171641.1 hypothetical protein LMG21510_01743 [Cupriavidus respiraculi]
MSIKNLTWRLFAREELSDALFANRPQYGLSLEPPNQFRLGLDAIGVGYAEDRWNRSYTPPGMVLLDDDSQSEILSWLRVNSPEIFPLSQFARVLTWADWSAFGESAFYKGDPKEFGREDRWASLITGEIIAQGDTDIDLSKLPLSRAAGCFSTAVARTHLTYGSKEALAVCIQRLKALELDQRFVRRHVSVKDLEPVWTVAKRAGHQVFSHEEAIDLVFHALLRDAGSSSQLNYFSRAHNLNSDSIEERVVAFNALIEELKKQPAEIRCSSACSSVLAVAAFLVGRSTSHEFLVRRNLEAFPYGPIWFGLLAGLVGSAHWDATWARAAKGVERQLRSKFRWDESAGFDLCWTEYAWYASTFEDSYFSAIPKLAQRVLSVEVVPGASCQLRMAAGHSPTATESREMPVPAELAGITSQQTLDIFAQLIKLAAKAEALTRDEHRQAKLFETVPASPRSRSKRTKGNI